MEELSGTAADPAAGGEVDAPSTTTPAEVVEGEARVCFVGDSVGHAERIVAFTAGASGACPTTQLTVREREVLELIASGSSNGDAAEHLTLSVRTVERQLLNAYRKLGVRSLRRRLQPSAASELRSPA